MARVTATPQLVLARIDPSKLGMSCKMCTPWQAVRIHLSQQTALEVFQRFTYMTDAAHLVVRGKAGLAKHPLNSIILTACSADSIMYVPADMEILRLH